MGLSKKGNFQKKKKKGGKNPFLLLKLLGKGRCRLLPSVRCPVWLSLRAQGKAGEEQLDRSISPLKKIFITKQILIKSGLGFNPTS